MKTVLYKGNRYNDNPYHDMDYQGVCFSIEDIKRVLGLDFSMYKKDGVVKKLSQEEINNYTENDNATGSFDEFIDELNTELNQKSYTELEQQNKTQANRIAELEQQLEELKQAQATQSPTVGNSQNYNPTERNTHLQMIAILAEELAKSKNGKYLKKSTGLPNHLNLSELLERLAKEIEIEAVTAKSVDTYRKRLGEASQYYKGN